MQEEVENRSVNLAVKTSKVTATGLYKILRAYVRHRKNKAAKKEATPVKGKQSVKELIGQGQGVSSMEISDSGLKEFKKIANKYGVDFAIVKDKSTDPPKHTVFFKARDADAISLLLKEYADKKTKKKEATKEKKPSVRKKLRKYKEQVANAPRKEKERRKDRER